MQKEWLQSGMRKIKRFLRPAYIAFFISLALIMGIAGINVLYPRNFCGYVGYYAKMFELEESLVNAVIRTESRFDPLATSHKNAKGLMQITDQTGSWAAAELNMETFDSDMLFEPEINILIGCWYLRKLLNQYDGDLSLALAAYNAGSGNVSRWLKDGDYSADGKTLLKIPYEETQKYLRRVNAAKIFYEFLSEISI